VIEAGGSQVIIAANGSITIKSGSKITIDAATDLDLKGANVTVTAAGSFNISAASMNTTSNIWTHTGSNVNINGTIRFNNGGKKISGIGDVVAVSGSAGIIQTGSPNVFTN